MVHSARVTHLKVSNISVRKPKTRCHLVHVVAVGWVMLKTGLKEVRCRIKVWRVESSRRQRSSVLRKAMNVMVP